ncbi:beta-1,3-galactosyltransferase GALT1-like [Juglans microcarpa x Juglans regia]|uniref:beta-1,3-galactosyltransferase GALT1-like n=1 Tax=Juglans microcarpa x Juglans regia TaxID=2249226 RepID=UPI001B7E053B|nr:beta-1,3-galactosyltransferase GALT1-like [Juglans microcarpa x Juglans regia]XP_041015335.1 beta-1,3-galactosyltransferase GALT1-like [Juglans microcarpa x Juglans regia]XP_041015336.1 beta-1,3-galactosyltransferase GALT1-like [Juglans microcarpa x Juglans regia]XP_041015337.1 beta-1,3-galactosyltransferase GALT1-like [Juglans microcarpa x Juglans regia]
MEIRFKAVNASLISRMKKWLGSLLVASLFMLLILRYGVMKNSIGERYLTSLFSPNASNPLELHDAVVPPAVQNPENASTVVPAAAIVLSLLAQRNISKEEEKTLQTWNHLKHLVNHSQGLPNAVDSIKDAGGAWNSLMDSVEEKRLRDGNESSRGRGKEKQCPYFLNKMNNSELDNSIYKLRVPCGLTQGSAITIIGIPNGLLGNFRIDLTGESLPGEPDPPIILHYNLRLHGDKITEDPVIVQNTWTVAHDWGEEERCPTPAPEKIKKVDDLDQCNKMVGKEDSQFIAITHSNTSRRSSTVQEGSKTRKYFPFNQNHPFVATLRVGLEGIQMTVDGKHITSFAFRETLEPWLVSEIKISGDLKLISVLASGLPTSEDSEHINDLETLQSVPLSLQRPLDLFIGVFSTANNFKRRMAVRRTWMQYPAVRSGAVAVRFFVGLHKNQIVNEELWDEARTYGDVQLMPFVDYYSLITWKTLAICIFGTEVVSAKFVMKTDDDAFVRVDEILASLNRINMAHGLLYGLINSDSRPDRNPHSKWYISPEEWPGARYPAWAHGPGYVVSHDIAKEIYLRYKKGNLKMFKLEDVAMGIWIADLKDVLKVQYKKEEKVYPLGCKDGYIVAHYQGPREMLCLWQKLQEGHGARCCGDR